MASFSEQTHEPRKAPSIVADKNCEKIHYMTLNIYCCGAGTAADTNAVTDMVSSQLRLHRDQTGRQSRVATALTLSKSHLFGHQGYVQAGLAPTCMLYILMHGSTDTIILCPLLPRGMVPLLLRLFSNRSIERKGLNKDEGVKLVAEAICSGIFNDQLGSGSNVDICVITKGKQEYLRNYMLPTV